MASSLPKSVNNNVRSEANSYKRSEKKKDSKQKLSNIICISPISNFKEKVFEAKNLLLTAKTVILTATGPSIPHAINLALILQSSHTVAIETTTSTVYRSEDKSNRKKYPSPAIKIIVELIAEKKSS